MAKDKPTTPIDEQTVRRAIELGQSLVAEGHSKADAVRGIYPLIAEEPREVIWQVFMQGAGLTEKGAITYHYNMKREAKKAKKKESN